MNPRLQARAEQHRSRRLHRHTRPGAELPEGSFVATIWRPARTSRWTLMRSPVFRATWDQGRSTAATCWPTGLDRAHHSRRWRLARGLWTLAALIVYTATIATGAAVVLARPLYWATTNIIGYLAVLAGWTPPLTDAHLADPEQALFTDDHEHHFMPPTPAASRPVEDADAGGWVDPVEREQARQHAADARHERQTSALEALAHQPTPTQVSAPTHPTTPVPHYPQQQRRPVSLRRWVLRAVIVMSVISATGLFITAWTLAALSAAGHVPDPPTSGELVDTIQTRTEARNNDIATQFEQDTGDTKP